MLFVRMRYENAVTRESEAESGSHAGGVVRVLTSAEAEAELSEKGSQTSILFEDAT